MAKNNSASEGVNANEFAPNSYDTEIKTIKNLLEAYEADKITPKEVVRKTYYRIGQTDTNAWIETRNREAVLEEAEALTASSSSEKPLYGIPFAVKDNIDYEELPTSVGCPAYTYFPDTTATVVEKLVDAGALLIGKTNMDQFATGLVGTRSPYGTCKNVFNEEYISGGSSSGSAVAVARGHVPFALGTDTAGSGRVPAALNGLIGLKPTRGVISTAGIVPGCKSLSCVSVLTRNVPDAELVEQVAAGYDNKDQYSRDSEDLFDVRSISHNEITIGIPNKNQLNFFEDNESENLFNDAISKIDNIFGSVERIDFSSFEEASDLLYNGPWVAERLTNVGDFIKNHPDDIDLTVRGVISDGEIYSASDAFEAFHRLERLKKDAAKVFEEIDAMMVPTIGTIYTIEGEQLNPIEINSQLGYYTNFVNLIDLCAISVPVGKYDQGPTFSISIIGEAFEDSLITQIAESIHTENHNYNQK